MKLLAVLAATGAATASAFVPSLAPVRLQQGRTVRMALSAELTKTYPRDFKNIPIGTSYGEWCVFMAAGSSVAAGRWGAALRVGALW
jgi:hypothetical protein